MRRILILTADYGFGHRSAANAIAEALHEMHPQDCQVEIINPLHDRRTPILLREQSTYDVWVREAPELWKLTYQVSDTSVASSLIKSTWTLMLFNVLREIIHHHQPDVIVSTYLFYQGILSLIFAIDRQRIPMITVVTDLATVTKLWFHPATDLCIVPTQTVYDRAIEAGLTADKIRITGIPVRLDLAKGNQDPSIRKDLGWRSDLFTVLAIGSKRVLHLYGALQALNHSGFPLQLVVVAGGDDELYQRLRGTEWHVQTHLYNYVTEMGTFMRGADCVLSKAGGLIVSEALACGLPMILIDVIPGQEIGNAEHVVTGDAGMLATDPMEVLEAMSHWLEKDRALYQQQAQNARRLGRPRAAYDVAELIWAAAGS